MCLPLIVSLIYQEGLTNAIAFIVPIILLLAIGYLFNVKKARNTKMLAREGFVIVGLTWFIVSLFGCIPFMITNTLPNFFDAFFEMVSGFTTTGASVITDVTKVCHSILFWRSFSHWIGGMGVLVLILAIIPESKDGSAMHILRAESPGPQVGKLVSKMQVTSRILYLIYLVLTIVLILLLWLGPDKDMTLFNSLIYGLGTAGTGGFAVDPLSLELYTPYSQYVISIFMIIFGINFSMFYLILIGNLKEVFKNEEIKWYFGIIIISLIIVTSAIYPMYNDLEMSFRKALFQIASIISTTGYSSANFDTWPIITHAVIVVLMIFGACAGSTAGGTKITRVNILFKSSVNKIKNMVNPRKVEILSVDGKKVEKSVIEAVQSYFVVYIAVLIVSTLLISIDNHDLTTNFTASLSCISNIGPGLSKVGPYGSFSIFSDFSTFILTIVMIAGRLELFPILVLFSPSTWKKRI